MENQNIVLLFSSSVDEFLNIYFNEKSINVINLIKKIGNVKHKTYEKIICEHNNNKIYINPFSGDIHEVIQENQYNHDINHDHKYIKYELIEKSIDIECIPILNEYHNQETYIVTEYMVERDITIIFFKQKDNGLVKIYGKTRGPVNKLINLMCH